MAAARALAALAACAALWAQPARADDDARSVYLGDWDGTGTSYATHYSKAGTSGGHTSCAWQVDKTYLVCAQSFTGPDGPGRALSVFTRTGNRYGFIGVDPDGKTRSLDLVVPPQGEIVWNSSFGEKDGTHVLMRTVNTFPSPGVERWRLEYSTDGGKTWTRMADGVQRRLAEHADR